MLSWGLEMELMMKVTRLMLFVVLTGLTGALVQGCAHEHGDLQSDQRDRNESYLTGSYLPQDVNRSGPVTNGKNDVRVIDRSDLNQSGGADVNQSLRQLGVTPH